jgi:hypothetical protein
VRCAGGGFYSSSPFLQAPVAWSSIQPDDPSEGVFAQRYEPILPVELIGFTVN